LPVEKFHGVGPATAAKMNRLGIKTGFDLREQTLAFLQQHFGKPGPYLTDRSMQSFTATLRVTENFQSRAIAQEERYCD
jgi:nucleotidyltransferase/DNA polymerase involved in DNA repair